MPSAPNLAQPSAGPAPAAPAAAGLAALHRSHLEVLHGRFDRALQKCGYTGVLIHSGTPPLVFQDDQNYPFRVNAWFKAWAPLTDVPDCFIYYEPGRKPLLLFHRPSDYWYKPADLPQGYWTTHFELVAVPDREAARRALPRTLAKVACVTEGFAELPQWGIEAINPPSLLGPLDYERAFKTPYEIACLRAANVLGARGHAAAARAFAAGRSGFEIYAAFLDACGAREQELPYNPIVALNASGAVLHYQLLGRRAPPIVHSLLIDAGAEFAGYACDITRTHVLADADFAALVRRFDQLQQRLCARARAGVDWRDLHLMAHQLVAELLKEADITRCGAEEAVASGVSSVFLPHGLGHLLGLQVHDVGGWMRTPEGGEIPRPQGHPFLRLTRVLEPGFVVTMEPGIYFIDQLLEQAGADVRATKINWSRVEALRKFGGIRIEDDLAITATGCENLTRQAFAPAAA